MNLNSTPQIIVLKFQMDWSNRTFVIVRENMIPVTFGPLASILKINPNLSQKYIFVVKLHNRVWTN